MSVSRLHRSLKLLMDRMRSMRRQKICRSYLRSHSVTSPCLFAEETPKPAWRREAQISGGKCWLRKGAARDSSPCLCKPERTTSEASANSTRGTARQSRTLCACGIPTLHNSTAPRPERRSDPNQTRLLKTLACTMPTEWQSELS